MHIGTVPIEKAAERTVKFSVSSFVCAYFKNFPRKYAQHRTYFKTFSRLYVIRALRLITAVSQQPFREAFYAVPRK